VPRMSAAHHRATQRSSHRVYHARAGRCHPRRRLPWRRGP
jgi:hypothetical protein